jgi:hypothetical protein
MHSLKAKHCQLAAHNRSMALRWLAAIPIVHLLRRAFLCGSCSPSVINSASAIKQQLWAQLLKLVYGREVESDALCVSGFVENDDRSLPSGSGPSARVRRFVIGQAPQVGRREVDPPLDPAGNGFFLQRALAQRCPSATPYWSNSCPRSICDACQPASAASTFRPSR